VVSWCHGDDQRSKRGARASARRWGGAWPVRVRDVHGRDASGMLACSARAFSGEGTAAMAMWSVLGEVDEHGGIVGHQGQWWR
jgi:hypothetical protein